MKSSFRPTFCLQVAISRALASFWRYSYLDQYLTPQALPKYGFYIDRARVPLY
jgi:hypothetical protein